MLIIVLILIILYILLLIYTSRVEPTNTEHFWNIIPYQYHWDIFKCLDKECLYKKGKACFDWCNNIREDNAAQQCRIGCSDTVDQFNQSLLFDYYTFNVLLPKFKKVSLYNKNGDWETL